MRWGNAVEPSVMQILACDLFTLVTILVNMMEMFEGLIDRMWWVHDTIGALTCINIEFLIYTNFS